MEKSPVGIMISNNFVIKRFVWRVAVFFSGIFKIGSAVTVSYQGVWVDIRFFFVCCCWLSYSKNGILKVYQWCGTRMYLLKYKLHTGFLGFYLLNDDNRRRNPITKFPISLWFYDDLLTFGLHSVMKTAIFDIFLPQNTVKSC